MGLSYKQNVSDCGESPAMYISEKISLENVNIHYVEPNQESLKIMNFRFLRMPIKNLIW